MSFRFPIAPITALVLLYQGVFACQCWDPFRTPYEEFDDSSAVFVGVVSGYTDNVIDAPNQWIERTFQFKVEETLKGPPMKNRDVTVGITREICYVGFGEAGSRYLVYADERSGKLHTQLFCRRRAVEPDLHFLRMKLRNVKEPRIYGMIYREKPGKSSPWPLRVQVIAESTGKKVLTKADKSGRFAFDELPDGFYLVKIEAQSNQQERSGQEYRIRLGDPRKVDDLGYAKKSVFLSFPLR